MSVTAKFYVRSISPSIEEAPDAASRLVEMGAVCRGAENGPWSSATPHGELKMTIRNDLATEEFKVGEEYLLTFTHAPKAES